MRTYAPFPRRIVLGAAALGVLGAVAASTTTPATAPRADAAPAACTAAGLASTASGVLNQAGGYLANHPGADNVLTAAASQPPEEARSSVQSYFLGHTNEFFDLQNIAQPLTQLKGQCGVSLSPHQMATLMDTLAGNSPLGG